MWTRPDLVGSRGSVHPYVRYRGPFRLPEGLTNPPTVRLLKGCVTGEPFPLHVPQESPFSLRGPRVPRELSIDYPTPPVT